MSAWRNGATYPAGALPRSHSFGEHYAPREEYSLGNHNGSLSGSFAAPLSHADNLPTLAVEDMRKRALEVLAVGRGDAEAESVKARWHQLASNFQAGRGSEVLQDLSVASPHRPQRGHCPCSFFGQIF